MGEKVGSFLLLFERVFAVNVCNLCVSCFGSSLESGYLYLLEQIIGLRRVCKFEDRFGTISNQFKIFAKLDIL